MRILVVDDEVRLCVFLLRALQQDGHDPHAVHDGRAGFEEARDGAYDLIVLDVELPGMDGIEVLKQLRALHVKSRIILLTAHSESLEKIAGLRDGADDYLTKPFEMNELLARIHALGRRFITPPERILQFADLTLKLDSREAWRGKRRIELSDRECALLEVLMHEPGRVFSRADLSKRIWEREQEYNNKAVEVIVGRLRKKIDAGASEHLIKTVHHLGYTLHDDPSI